MAGTYRRALRELEAQAEVGEESARVSVICHCLREVVIGLPAVLSDRDEPRPDPSSGSLVKRVQKLVTRRGLNLDVEQDLVPVPNEVARAFHALVVAAIQEEGRNKRRAAALVTGTSDTKHPAVAQWDDAYQFLVGWAHLDRNHEKGRPLPTDDELIGVLRVIEDVVEVRTTVFFDNVESIEDLLQRFNAVGEAGS